MKKFFTLLLTLVMGVACLSFSACGGSDKNTLQVYTNAGFAPYEFVNKKGEVVGVDMDIMKEIGSVLGYKVVINDIEFNQILDEVGKNELAIGAAGMTKTAERDEIALSSISYARSVQYVIAAKDTFDSQLVNGKLPLEKLEILTKKTIGYQNGTTGEYMLTDAIEGTTGDNDQHITGELEGKNVTSVGYTNAIVASQDIGSSLGAVIIDKLPAQSIVAANSSLECYELDAEPEEYVLYLNKNATELLSKVNKVLESLISNGVIDYFTLKHSGGIIAEQ